MNDKEREKIYKRIMEIPAKKIYFSDEYEWSGDIPYAYGEVKIDNKKYCFIYNKIDGIVKNSIDEVEK